MVGRVHPIRTQPMSHNSIDSVNLLVQHFILPGIEPQRRAAMIRLALEVLAFLFLCWVGWYGLMLAIAILSAIGDALGKLFTPASRPPSSKTPFALGHDPIEPNHDPRTCSLCLKGGHRDDFDSYARAPRGMSTDELYRWAAQERGRGAVREQEREKDQIETPPQETQSQRERQIEAIQRDFSSSLAAATTEESEWNGKDRQIEGAEQNTQLKHIPGLPWGDPSSYVRASTPDELEQAREGFHRREVERRDALAAKEREATSEQERKKRDDEKREKEAREFLIRESAAAWRGIVFIDQWGRVWEWKKGDPEPVCKSEPAAPFREVDLNKLDLTEADRRLLAALKVKE
jgi:hypothetical protein